MGRKGVSKRKSSQPKSKPFADKNGGGSVSSAMQAGEPQQVKSFDTAKTDASTKGSSKKTKKG